MSIEIACEILTENSFRSFGNILETRGRKPLEINDGKCLRYDDLATLEVVSGKIGISIFDSKASKLPHIIDYVERHPQGSQAFIPMYETKFLVVVAKTKVNTPQKPKAFIAQAGQGVNIHKGIWHGVLTPIEKSGMFAVIDRIGPGENLEKFYYQRTYSVNDVNF